MDRKMFLKCVWMCLIMVALMPNDMWATTTDAAFGGAAISTQATTIQGFLFGPIMRLVGVIGGGYGLLMSIMTSTMKPLVTYGGLGMAVNVVPAFVNGVFTVLLP